MRRGSGPYCLDEGVMSVIVERRGEWDKARGGCYDVTVDG